MVGVGWQHWEESSQYVCKVCADPGVRLSQQMGPAVGINSAEQRCHTAVLTSKVFLVQAWKA